jgi:hypothetical protein
MRTRHPSPFSFIKSVAQDEDNFWYEPGPDPRLLDATNIFPRKLRRILIIASDYEHSTGVMKSLSHYTNAMLSRGDFSVTTIELRSTPNHTNLRHYLQLFDFVLINGVQPFFTNNTLALALSSYSATRCALYLHETEWVFNVAARSQPAEARALFALLSRIPVLCVSFKQRNWLHATYNAPLTYVVREHTQVPAHHEPHSASTVQLNPSDPLTVVMSGTLQHRKGATLFSRTADLAAGRSLPWRFIWAGRATGDTVYRSPHVTYVGHLSDAELHQLLHKTDIFFLASQDDPLPLAAIEALLQSKRVVAFKDTGIAELIYPTDGCWQTFPFYTAESALDAMLKACQSPLSPQRAKSIRDMFSLPTFVETINKALCKITSTPRHSVLFFCENANHVRLAHDLTQGRERADDLCATIHIATYDWANTAASWVSKEMARLAWDAPHYNIFREAPLSAQTRFYKADPEARLGIISQSIIRRFLELLPLMRGDLLVIIFNDSSVRGRIISAACRELGVRRLLIQDGFLTFRSKSGNLSTTDQNFFWGHSKPFRYAVWGEEMQKQLTTRFGVKATRILVTGPTSKMKLPKVVNAKTEKPARVLWVDQAVLDQKKASESDWLAEFAMLAKALAKYSTVYRPHPSTSPQVLSQLLSLLPSSICVSPEQHLSNETLATFTCMVTYYSTAFIDSLAANLHCFFYATNSLDIEMTFIRHPLLHYSASIDDLLEGIDGLPQHLTEMPAGDDIIKHIAAPGAYADAASIIPGLLRLQ